MAGSTATPTVEAQPVVSQPVEAPVKPRDLTQEPAQVVREGLGEIQNLLEL